MRYNCRQIPLHRPLIGSFHSSPVEREICHVPDGCARHIGLCISHSIKEGRTKREEFGKCRKSSEKDLDGGETFLIFKQQQTRKKEKKEKWRLKGMRTSGFVENLMTSDVYTHANGTSPFYFENFCFFSLFSVENSRQEVARRIGLSHSQCFVY